MSYQSRFEKAYLDADIVATQAKLADNLSLKPIILAILEDLNKKLGIFEVNDDGSLKLNEKGFPIVKWGFLASKILLNLPTILGYLARIWAAARQ